MSRLDHMVKANRDRNKHINKSSASTTAKVESQAEKRMRRTKRRRRRNLTQHLPPEQQPEVMLEQTMKGAANEAEEAAAQDEVVAVDGNQTDDESMSKQTAAASAEAIDVSGVGDTDVMEEVDASLNRYDSSHDGPFYRPSKPWKFRDTAPDDDLNIPGQVTLELPAPLLDVYRAQAPSSTPLRHILAERLERCQQHTATKPIYLSDKIRQRIDAAAGRNFDNGEELAMWLESTPTISCGDIQLTVDTDLLERALLRKPEDQSVEECLSEYLTAGIEIKTGLR